MKNEVNKRRYNLLINNEVTLFIFNERKNLYFHDIMLAERYANEIIFKFTHYKHFNFIYLSLHYIFFFSFN